MNKTELFLELTKISEKQESWVKSLPEGLYSCFVENQYNQYNEEMLSLLLESVFTEAEIDDIYWWWYEFKFVKDHGPHVEISAGEEDYREYTFKTTEDFIEYLVKEHNWENLNE